MMEITKRRDGKLVQKSWRYLNMETIPKEESHDGMTVPNVWALEEESEGS